MPREFRFDFTAEDHVLFNIAHYRRDGVYRRLRLGAHLIMNLAVPVCVGLAALLSGDPTGLLLRYGVGLSRNSWPRTFAAA